MNSPARQTVFEDFASLYEALIDWPARLANETLFFRRWFERVGARRVLDAACGPGHHARLFHAWGLEVEGADLSAAMIAGCRAQHGEPPGLNWVQRSFTEPAGAGRFDAAICVGNSLAVAPDVETVHRALAAMATAVRPGGAIIVQVLNLWRMEDGPTLWQKCKQVRIDGVERILLKGIHRCGRHAYVDLVEIREGAEGTIQKRADTTRMLGLERTHLEDGLRAAGAKQIHLFGDYQETAYDPSGSVDLVVVGIRD